VTIALRPEAVRVVAPGGAGDAIEREARPNEVSAPVEKVVYHGFVSHLYLRQANGEPLIAFPQNAADASTAIEPGRQARAFWWAESNHVVRD
jgi:hypothetical protein